MTAKISALTLLVLLAAAPARATFNLTVSTAGPASASSRVTSSPAGIDCPSTCTFAFAEGSTVTLTRVMASTVAFVGWGGPDGCRTNKATCFLTLNANANVSAQFAPTLDLSISGNGLGVVRSSGSTSAICASTGTCTPGTIQRMVLQTGTTVVLQATAGSSTTFTGWTASAGGCSTASTCTVVMDGYRTVVATFTASASSYTIRVVLPNAGGIVTSSPSGISCGSTSNVCAAAFAANTNVSLTTAAKSGYRFAGWANGGCYGNSPCVVKSTSPLQGLGGKWSPAAYFYATP